MAADASSLTFPKLFTPLPIGSVTIRNRIVSSGHDTVMAEDGFVTDRLIAYQAARAAVGVGLIVVQVAGVHESARYTSHVLMATEDTCIPGFRRLAGSPPPDRHRRPDLPDRRRRSDNAAHRPGLGRPQRALPAARGRPLLIERSATATPPRRVGCERGSTASSRASHGYLPAEFSARVNLRTDRCGGAENHLLPARERSRRSAGQ
jgi:hypothetical protein